MYSSLVLILVFFIAGLLPAGGVQAQVETKVLQTLKLEKPPLDAVMSFDAKHIYVLVPGELLVYAAEGGQLEDRVKLQGDFDTLRPTSRENQLLLGSRKENTLQVVTLDFVRNINTEGSPFKGPAKAPVVMAVFSDFECAACAGLVPVIDQMAKTYPDRLKIVFKNFPLSTHRNARAAAAGALSAARQGKFWEFHDRLFANYKDFNPRKLGEIAKEVGLDPAKLQQDLKDVLIIAALNRDVTDGVKAGVRGTPTVFINGRLLRDTSARGFQEMIDKELNRQKG